VLVRRTTGTMITIIIILVGVARGAVPQLTDGGKQPIGSLCRDRSDQVLMVVVMVT
jgi:hypothetical protein